MLALVSTALTVSLVAGVGEWAVRYRERARTSTPGTMSMLFYRHKRLMHGVVHGMDYYGWVHIGPQGFRGARDVGIKPPPNTIRIVAAGGSTTFDANTSGDSSAWPARLEQILDSSAAPLRFEVLNAGVPGFQVFDDLVRLESELWHFQPDLVILYQGHNDLFNTLSRGPARAVTAAFDPRPDEVPGVYPWQMWLEHHSLLYHKVSSKLEAISFRSEGKQQLTQVTPVQYQSVINQGATNYATAVRAYLAVAQSLGVRVVVPQVVYAKTPAAHRQADSSAIASLWSLATPFAPLSVVERGYAAYDSSARAAATDLGGIYVPAPDAQLWTLDSYAAGDPIHFNDQGSLRFARELAEVILRLPEVQKRRGVIGVD